LQLILVSSRGFVGICGIGRNRVDVGSRRPAIQKDLPRHAHVVERIVGRDKTLVADKPVHAVPRDPASKGIGREQLVELFRARSAGQADRHAIAVGGDHPCYDTLRGGFGERDRVGNLDHFGVHLAMIVPSHPI
jgi:hypothetical protein